MPEKYHTAHICNILGITYTDLMNQPAEWVEQMLEYREAQGRADENRSKKKRT